VEEPIVFDSSDFEEKETSSGYKVIDLVDKDVPDPEPESEHEEEEVEKKEKKNTVKLGTFQCVICMDDVKDLTVTHCGLSSSPSPLPHIYSYILRVAWLLTRFVIARPPLLFGMSTLVPPHRRHQEGLSHMSPEGRDKPRRGKVHSKVQGVLAARAEAHDQ
jgi:hypothetical protein